MALATLGTVFDELVPPFAADEALLEADRCLECGGSYAEAPCTVACPADIDVAGFISAIAREDLDQAAATILSANVLGGTCARVCPVEELCEGACVLTHEGQPPIEIGRLQRFATDGAFARDVSLPVAAPNGRRVAVLGAGPAGLACAAELAMLGYRVTVYEGRPETGGLVRFAIAPYRQQREPLPAETRMIERLGVDIRLGEEIETPEALRAVEAGADALVLAVGLGKDVEADFEGNDLPGVWDSLPFIEAIKTGGPPSVGEHVVVIGGGNTAVDVAREALLLGASEATMVYRRTEAEMPAYRHEIEEARREGVGFRFLTQPFRFVGADRLEAIDCREMRLGSPDASGRPRPEPVPGSEFRLPADTVVKAIGQTPRRELLSWIDGLATDEGLVEIDPATGQTANPRYFATGDAVNGGKTVVDAVRSAKVAARGIHALLNGGRR